MGKPKVLIARPVSASVEEYIGKYCDYEVLDEKDTNNYDLLLSKVHDKEGLLLARINIDENLLSHAPKLKVVSNISVGYNNFDIEKMKERNVIGTHTPEVLDDTVADLAFGLILTTARRLSELDQYVKEGKWNTMDAKCIYGKDVHHSTLGIIGMGRIGEKVAKRAKLGFDMDVLYHNRTRKYEVEKNLGVQHCDFETLLRTSDFILVMTPLTKETHHLIDENEFNIMKKDAIIINASRGSTINENALIKALEEKKILGAGLDVYEKEPVDINNPLLTMPNVVTLPHIGSATEKTRDQMAMLAAENMVKALCGENPPNIVPELQ